MLYQMTPPEIAAATRILPLLTQSARKIGCFTKGNEAIMRHAAANWIDTISRISWWFQVEPALVDLAENFGFAYDDDTWSEAHRALFLDCARIGAMLFAAAREHYIGRETGLPGVLAPVDSVAMAEAQGPLGEVDPAILSAALAPLEGAAWGRAYLVAHARFRRDEEDRGLEPEGLTERWFEALESQVGWARPAPAPTVLAAN